jgi:hypothetical protein
MVDTKEKLDYFDGLSLSFVTKERFLKKCVAQQIEENKKLERK